ncbi:MAG: hypothetical protein GF353_06775 [Candidatus Lokiarchaeota archaeon]|nr:hypothetical protein [Candidatus Lokiarchaeota archaeon]
MTMKVEMLKISRNGQITLPQEIRKKLKIIENDCWQL